MSAEPDRRWLSLPEVHQRISAEEDPLLWKRLLVITASLMRNKSYCGIPLSTSHRPEDFIHTALEKVLSGRRRMRVGSDLLHFLGSSVRSEINNTITKKVSGQLQVSAELIPANSQDPLFQQTANGEQTLLERESREQILKLFANDKQVLAIAQLAIDDGPMGREEFAAALGLTVEQVTNIKKRMQKIYTPYLKARQGGRKGRHD